jgi:hypothetical protein
MGKLKLAQDFYPGELNRAQVLILVTSSSSWRVYELSSHMHYYSPELGSFTALVHLQWFDIFRLTKYAFLTPSQGMVLSQDKKQIKSNAYGKLIGQIKEDYKPNEGKFLVKLTHGSLAFLLAIINQILHNINHLCYL